MKRLAQSRWLATIAVLLFAGLSIVSAHARAPAPPDAALATFLAMGGEIDDLCGDARHADDAPHCAYCRTSTDVALTGPTLVHAVERGLHDVDFQVADPPHMDLDRAARAGSPRAPPLA